MINKIAASVRPFALDVRRGMYDDGKMYIAVVNTVRSLCVSVCFVWCSMTNRLTGRLYDALSHPHRATTH